MRLKVGTRDMIKINISANLKRLGHFAGVAAIAGILTGIAGCQTASRTPLPNQPATNTAVTLSPGDVIKLSFPGSTDLNQSQKIRTDGKVSLPLIGEVTAAGKTL